MPISKNESIIAVPVSVEQEGQTRQFLVRLVERLDLVIGTRGGDPYVPESRLADTASSLTKLEQTVLEIIEGLLVTDSTLTDSILEETLAAIEALKSPAVIANADASTSPFGGSYSQTEADDHAAQTAANAGKLNELLTALRGTGIIAT
jgi:hypothetical protein